MECPTSHKRCCLRLVLWRLLTKAGRLSQLWRAPFRKWSSTCYAGPDRFSSNLSLTSKSATSSGQMALPMVDVRHIRSRPRRHSLKTEKGGAYELNILDQRARDGQPPAQLRG